MSFQSLSFLAFLLGTLAVCLPAGRRSPRAGQIALCLCSAVFYLLGSSWRALLVLLLGAGVTALALRGFRRPGLRRRALILGCGWHIVVLLVFKYTAFFTGGRLSVGTAPLGLSFFTFQQLWLLHAVYTRQADAVPESVLPLYALFFPTVTSGPILKPQDFFPQLQAPSFLHPSWQDASAALYLLSVGTMKKVLLADPLGIVVRNGWRQPDALSAPGAWVVLLGYTLQLYLDFSGYCDIAAGLARLLGIRLPQNFNSPYRSLSVGTFWKRWHITLTNFFRECVYFPLGGSRRGTLCTYRNILYVYLLSGFWHGAGWTFLVWGLLHGLAQVAERLWGNRRDRLPRWLQWCGTFLFLNVAWAFFRAPSLSAAGTMLHQAVFGGWDASGVDLLSGLFVKELDALGLLFPNRQGVLSTGLAAVLYGVSLVCILWPRNAAAQADVFRPRLWQCVLLAGGLVWSILSFTGISTFIYSNF